MVILLEYTTLILGSPDLGLETRWASPALQGLERWLARNGASNEIAASASLGLWVYQVQESGKN